MRALVTGGAGFIGSHVVDALLARGDEVVVVDSLATGKRENVPAAADLRVQDIREPLDGLFEEVRPEAIFHLAAQADVRVSVERAGRGRGGERPRDRARARRRATPRRRQVVFSSTGGAIYGECDGPAARDCAARAALALRDRESSRGRSTCGRTTACTGRSTSSSASGTCTGHVRIRTGKQASSRSSSARSRGGEQARIFGDGEQTRDYVYVGDVARATLAALGQEGGVFNIGTGRETSVNELYELCRSVAGSDAEAAHVPARPGELQRSVLDPVARRGRPRVHGLRRARGRAAGDWEWLRAAQEE